MNYKGNTFDLIMGHTWIAAGDHNAVTDLSHRRGEDRQVGWGSETEGDFLVKVRSYAQSYGLFYRRLRTRVNHPAEGQIYFIFFQPSQLGGGWRS
jgi:hypothetical protein